MKTPYEKFVEVCTEAQSYVSEAEGYLKDDDIDSAAESIDTAKKLMYHANKKLLSVADAQYGVGCKKQAELSKMYFTALGKIAAKAC